MQLIKSYDVLCIGSTIVDYSAFVSEAWFKQIGAEKGGVLSISSAAFAQHLGSLSHPPLIRAGGSAGTVAKGLGQLGCQCAFLSRSGIDQNAIFFRSVLKGNRVDVFGPMVPGQTARVMCVITPDGERTFLFQADEISGTPRVEDLDESLFERARIVHIEGYTVRNRELLIAILEMAGRHKVKVSLDLGSFVLVREHRAFLKDLILEHVNFLFGNAEEMAALFGTTAEVDPGLRRFPGVSIYLQDERGCTLYNGRHATHFRAERAPHVVDSSGAGDLFISGFLFGISLHWPLEECVAIAMKIGKTIVARLGAELPPQVWEEIKEGFLSQRECP